jgi:hypothetical protein
LPRVHPPAISARCGLETNATFKYAKADLSRDGYDPTVTSDAIYFDDAAKGRFVGLDRALYGRPQAGKVRI